MLLARCLRTSLGSSALRPPLLLQAPPLQLCPATSGFASGRASLSHGRLLASRLPQGRGSYAQVTLPLPRPNVRRTHSLSAPGAHRLEGPGNVSQLAVAGLPAQCTGCGALSQTVEPDRAGYYSLERNDVKRCLGLEKPPPATTQTRREKEDSIVKAALRAVDPEKLEKLGVNVDALMSELPDDADRNQAPPPPPLCDRCHRLIHHSEGVPIHHPSMEALHETIDESPYKYNHVYHVIDAADFPMSLLPNIHELLKTMPLRSQNRRSRSAKFYKGRMTEISFIITRTDLLAPKYQQISKLMPYFQEGLREALGRRARRVRLGNLYCVGAKNLMWTQKLKEDIWQRGGGNWLVGKVNVGKSRLFEAVFPKGRMHEAPAQPQITVGLQPKLSARMLEESAKSEPAAAEEEHVDELDEYSLLPPARPETNYPEMPIVSSLPGTTASPIRVPFGSGKGELVDLPGLERSSLEQYVRPEHRDSLVMKKRIKPEQQTIQPGKSLLLGGFIRITPQTPGLTFLSYAFVPLAAHLTSTEKAIAIQGQTGEVNVENIAVEGAAEKTKLAGTFKLRWDVTKSRAGPLTRRNAVNLKVERLPFRVVAADILIEGCGWIELVAQVRAKQLLAGRSDGDSTQRRSKPAAKKPKPRSRGEILQTLDLSEPGDEEETPAAAEAHEHDSAADDGADDGIAWPAVEVYSPEGKFVGVRAPVNAWEMNKREKPDRGRPRKSMKGEKKRAKMAARQANQAAA